MRYLAHYGDDDYAGLFNLKSSHIRLTFFTLITISTLLQMILS